MDPFVAHHLQGVSRTYALLIPMLPRGLADSVGLAYLLMRIVDTIEDATELTTEARLEQLARLEAALVGVRADPPVVTCPPELSRPVGDLPAERDLMMDAPRVFGLLAAAPVSQREPIVACALAMASGVRKLHARSAERGVAYPGNRDAAELREYCYYVAGVVGEMLCTLMADYLRQPALLRLRHLAVELGLGLQLVNILKDCLRDARAGRRYLPVNAEGDLAPGEVYRAVLAEARESLRRGAEFVLALPAAARELRLFCGLPIAWGALTLSRAQRDAGRAKIGRGAVRASIALFQRLAGDDGALRAWFSRVLAEPGPRAQPTA